MSSGLGHIYYLHLFIIYSNKSSDWFFFVAVHWCDRALCISARSFHLISFHSIFRSHFPSLSAEHIIVWKQQQRRQQHFSFHAPMAVNGTATASFSFCAIFLLLSTRALNMNTLHWMCFSCSMCAVWQFWATSSFACESGVCGVVSRVPLYL